MTDPSNIRRPSLLLALTGAICFMFFVCVTDPRTGVARFFTGPVVIDESAHPFIAATRKFFGESTVDAVHQATIPTIVGLAGSAIITLIGLRLLSRKST